MKQFDKDLWDVILQGLQLLALIISAIWAYIRFFREGTHRPRIEFGVTCTFYGPHHGSHLASFTITANNKGSVEHRFSEIRLKVLGIRSDTPFKYWQTGKHIVAFPEPILRGVNIVPDSFGYYFVRPGVCQDFNFPTYISTDIRFIIVRATFKYQNTKDLHTTEAVFEVKSGSNEPVSIMNG